MFHIPRKNAELKKGYIFIFFCVIIDSLTFELFLVILNYKVISIICLDLVLYFIQTSATPFQGVHICKYVSKDFKLKKNK